MDYVIYQMIFPAGVHIGQRALDRTGFTLQADTLFSALCTEAVHQGKDILERWLDLARSDAVRISDAMPFCGEEYFLPKPMLRVTSDHADSRDRKVFKALSHIPASAMETYLAGRMTPQQAKEYPLFGKRVQKQNVAIRGREEPLPYRTEIFYFDEGNGLYVIMGYETKEVLEFAEELWMALSYSGIGGKRASGLGRFDLFQKKLPEVIARRLEANGQRWMSLSLSLPTEEELPNVLVGAQYLLEKRSGFVTSEQYATVQKRKRDLYALAAGSCFMTRFCGNIYDVSSGGNHPVYRYAKPMFLEVSQ